MLMVEKIQEKIIEYCNGVVVNGTGKTARPAGYAIGGKTGTAETIPRDKTNYVVSFMGYAPADNPQIAIYVVVDRPNTNYQDDAKFATRIVRNILTETLPYLNIYMTEELSESEKAELEELNIYVKKAAGIKPAEFNYFAALSAMITTISPTFFIEVISFILNFILNSFSTALISVICSKLSQSSISSAVVVGVILMLSSSNTSWKTLLSLINISLPVIFNYLPLFVV